MIPHRVSTPPTLCIGIAGSQRRCDFPGSHQQRQVPRNDLACNIQRLRRRSQAKVLQLVGPASVVEEVLCGGGYIEVPGFLDRLAVVEVSTTASSRDRSAIPRAIRRRYLPRSAPGMEDQTLLVRAAGGFDRSVDVGPSHCGDCRKPFTGPRVDGVAILAATFFEGSVDERQVAVPDIGNGTRLGRRGAFPVRDQTFLSPRSRSRRRSQWLFSYARRCMIKSLSTDEAPNRK